MGHGATVMTLAQGEAPPCGQLNSPSLGESLVWLKIMQSCLDTSSFLGAMSSQKNQAPNQKPRALPPPLYLAAGSSPD